MHQKLHTPMKQDLDESLASFMYISVMNCHGNCARLPYLHMFAPFLCAQVDDIRNRSLPCLALFLHQCPIQEIVKNRPHHPRTSDQMYMVAIVL